ncbi:Reticulocyte-binding protein 2 protein [Lasiodiplodia theobromae]|uniref:Reticulocyte-binding protein 2 protein n=1 Tax=Lasiodiplodia theobromae TaxID=45133 RepID=UPI0015C3D527|nr:Reticulocyte-binding protein 2 protein [Lasiodiplodia theobromae]KAF4535248.1 Reticulocyte-binding protein 2 protein [Lasiodiplodia theobromae]
MASSQLHDALKCLRPKNFTDDVPLDDLQTWMRDIFANAETIVNSVPQVPGGTDFLSSKRKRTDVNGAHNASEMTIADARAPPFDPSYEPLQKAWGKPIKVNNNPLSISTYKMAGADRYGSWFARRSVHEGLGFAKWKRALQQEFAESLAVDGGPGVGSIRGIGGDKMLERKVVGSLGKLEVLQLSAKFPAPTAPREFITMLLTSDNALSEKSKPHVDDHPAADQIPRHYIVVSIPCDHPEAPIRDGLVRGNYESVEMIREIPLTPAKSRDGGDITRKEEGSPDDPETNPVEWIMITRSDPGGGIPRFLIDRGTPGSIVADTSKFLDWACAKEDIPDPEQIEQEASASAVDNETLQAEEEAQPRASFSAAARNVQLTGVGTSIADLPLTEPSTIKHGKNNSSFFSTLSNAMETGIQNYAPASVASYLQPSSQNSSLSYPGSDSASDTSSINSFASAEQWTTANGGPNDEDENAPPLPPRRRISDGSVGSDLAKSQSNQNRYEREMQKLDSKRAALDEKMRKMKEKEQARTQQASEREEREKRKAVEKYQREMEKLAAKRDKEAQKREQRKKKEEEKNVITRLQRERDEFKTRAEMAEHENRLLKEQIGELQHQNTRLVQNLGKSEQGKQVLKAIEDEMGRGRSSSATSSVKSKSSKRSIDEKPAA